MKKEDKQPKSIKEWSDQIDNLYPKQAKLIKSVNLIFIIVLLLFAIYFLPKVIREPLTKRTATIESTNHYK